jgi:hypothetical protein
MAWRLWFAFVLIGIAGALPAGLGPGDSSARGREWLGEVRLPPCNYVRNGGFEAGLEGWQYFLHKAGGVDAAKPFAGSAAFRLEGFDESRHVYLYQYRIPLVTGRTYTLSAAVRTEGLSQANCDFGVLFLTNYGWTEAAVLKPAAPTTDWTVLRTTFTAHPTRPRPDGKPDYSLVAYWPPKSQGKVWLDNVQIEEGDQATAFSDLDLRPGLEALDRLAALAARLAAAEEALATFPEGPLIANLKHELGTLRAQAGAAKADLLGYEGLDNQARADLTSRLEAADSALAASQVLVWTGPAHIPLSEVTLPAARPRDLSLGLTCVQDEHRDVALDLANLTTTGFDARLEISELYSEGLAVSVNPGEWCTAYSAPRLRGFARPDQLFTDPLPELGDAGIFQVAPAGISQVILSVFTGTLLPGSYTGTLTVASLADRACRQSIPLSLEVLPFRLPALSGVDVTDCYGYVDYARQPLLELGLNTFSMPTSWMDIDFAPDGALSRCDFARLALQVQEDVPSCVADPRFLFLNLQGMYRFLEDRYGWQATEPRFEKAVKAWLSTMAAEMRGLNVEPARLIVETFDEPGPGDLPMAVQMARWVKEAVPGMQTMFYASGVSHDAAWIAAAKAHDIVAPSVAQCSPENLALLKGLGCRLWVYDCQANAETFHPLAYYRLMPWLCWANGIQGWGHFHWFNTSHDRPYHAWDGVEAQNLVYPGQAGTAPVLSRRYLAIRAGHEDYRSLGALERAVASATPDQAEAATQAKAFLAAAGPRALELSPRRPHYETQIVPGLPPDRLDRLREEAVARIDALCPTPGELAWHSQDDHGRRVVSFDAPVRGELVRHQWLGGEWAAGIRRPVDAGPASVCLESVYDRELIEFRGEDGRIWLGSTFIIPRISVDSTAPGYSQRPLNDGVWIAAVKFEPQYAWISSAEPVEHWVELDLGKPRQVSELRLWWMTSPACRRRPWSGTSTAGNGSRSRPRPPGVRRARRSRRSPSPPPPRASSGWSRPPAAAAPAGRT